MLKFPRTKIIPVVSVSLYLNVEKIGSFHLEDAQFGFKSVELV